MALFPKNTLRKGGVALVAAGPVLAAVLGYVGVGECTPEELEAGCVGAKDMAGALVGLVGGVVYWVGRNRAAARGDPG